jgi:hypothetical protein
VSKDIRVTWSRAGVPLSPDLIPMQLDNMSVAEAAYYSGTQPYFRYNGYVNTTQYPFLFQDLLTDAFNIDPKTQQLTKYRVINDPEFFVDNHVELALDRVVGT